MEWTTERILEHVRNQLRKKTAQKSGWKKKAKKSLLRAWKIFCFKSFGKKGNVMRTGRTSKFGLDEFGRDVEKGLKEYVDLLKKRGLDLQTVILLGSRVKSKCNPESDVDITVIASNLPRERNHHIPFGEILEFRRWLYLSDRPLFLGVEPSGCCSKEEFIHRLENFDVQALDALYYGTIIYDDGFWIEARRRFRQIEKKYQLEETGLQRLLYYA